MRNRYETEPGMPCWLDGMPCWLELWAGNPDRGGSTRAFSNGLSAVIAPDIRRFGPGRDQSQDFDRSLRNARFGGCVV